MQRDMQKYTIKEKIDVTKLMKHFFIKVTFFNHQH